MKENKKVFRFGADGEAKKLLALLERSNRGQAILRNVELSGLVVLGLVILSFAIHQGITNASRGGCGDFICSGNENSATCQMDCQGGLIQGPDKEKRTDSYKRSFEPIAAGQVMDGGPDARYIVRFNDPSYLEAEAAFKKRIASKELTEGEAQGRLAKYRQEAKAKREDYKRQLRKADARVKFGAEYGLALNGLSVKGLDRAGLERLKKLPFVKSIEADQEVKAFLLDTPSLTGATGAWNYGYTGDGIRVAVLDTGIDYAHADLGGCLGESCKVKSGYDFYNNDADPMDDHGHGTHVAGIIAADGAVKGIAYNSSLYAFKVLGSAGYGYESMILSALDRALDPNQDGDLSDRVDVVNMSLGGSGDPDDALSSAVDNVARAGVVVVVAAGNSGPQSGTIGSPGTARKALTVGAVDKSDALAYFSSAGPTSLGTAKPDLVAPGVSICSSQWAEYSAGYGCIDSDHVSLSGTSMATPHAAAAAALLLQAHPDWTPDEIRHTLKNTARTLGYGPYRSGAGSLDIAAAISQTERPPVATIDTYGKRRGVIDVVGTVKSDDFQEYILEYGEGYAPVIWTKLIASTSLSVASSGQAVLYSELDTSKFKETAYTLRLKVTNAATGSSSAITSTDYASFEPDNVYLTAPAAGSIFTSGTIEVRGTALGSGLSGYRIEYSPYAASQWQIIASGSEAVSDSLLAVWDTAGVAAGSYDLRVVTVDADGHEGIASTNVFIDTTLATGWPLETMPLLTGISLVDWSATGSRRLVGNSFNDSFFGSGHMNVFSPDGRRDPAFYDNAELAGQLPPAGQLDGAPGAELAVGYNNNLHAVGRTGADLPGWPQQFSFPASSRAMAMADLDQDGIDEIVYAPSDFANNKLYAFRRDGTLLPGWPVEIGTSTERLISVGDINRDGHKEIVVKSWLADSWQNPIDVRDYQGRSLPGWPKSLTDINSTALVTGDINGDGNLEIIFGGRRASTNEFLIYAADKDGNLLPGWPQNLGVYNYASDFKLALSDLDQDQRPEVIASALNRIFILNEDGSALSAAWPKTLAGSSSNPKRVYGLLSGDIDGDRQPEILAYYNFAFTDMVNPVSYIGAWKADGSFIKEWPLPGGPTGQFVLGDFDGNDRLDLVAAGHLYEQFSPTMAFIKGSRLFYWNLDAAYDPASQPWPAGRHNSSLVSSYPAAVPACADQDGDGFDACAPGEPGDDGRAVDCNDQEYWSNPGGQETCDTVDNDCSGQADEGCDDDQDGYCDTAMAIFRANSMCQKTVFQEGRMGDDCNDAEAAISPTAAEICGNAVDENCQAADDSCVCGNGVCELGENCTACAQDCISKQTDKAISCSSCSRGRCDGICNKESASCSDCVAAYCCGNGVCESKETASNCKIDCGCKSDAACNDNNSCTADKCTDGLCSRLWPTCGAADGCCAPGCTSLTDKDCPVLNCKTCQGGVCDGVCNKRRETSTCGDCASR